MIFSIHNEIKVKTNKKTYIFNNTLCASILQAIADKNGYSNYFSIGTGSTDSSRQNAYHLTSPKATLALENSTFQSDISKGQLFANYEYLLSTKNLNVNYITEAGLSDSSQDPIIYNYFSFIDSENPNGIDITNSDEISFEVKIYLTVNENNETLLTSGQNPFIEYLLGSQIESIFICTGSNYSANNRINRLLPSNANLVECEFNAQIQNSSLSLNLVAEMDVGEIDEILFVTKNKVFARKNIKEEKNTTTIAETFEPKQNYIIKISDDIKEVDSVINNTTSQAEVNCKISKYANDFGDEINFPDQGLFSYLTPRFISKDNNIIFFLYDDKVYAYKNTDYSFVKIDTRKIDDDYITKIISIEDYVFVFSKLTPYISTYTIDQNNIVQKTQNNFNSYENYSDFAEFLQFDIALSDNDTFMLGYLDSNKNAITMYFSYDSNNGYCYTNFIKNTRTFNHVFAMQNNHFCDAKMFYLKEGETSLDCRLVIHFPDKSETDVYTSLAYNLVHDAKNIYCKSRAIIAEKDSSPYIVIFYYPQVYQYELSLIDEELHDYVSGDLNYLIQKNSNNSYQIYNLVGYTTPENFINNFPDSIDQSKILDFEFLKDTLIIFQDDTIKPIIALNLNLGHTQIENVSSKTDNYSVTFKKFNKVGANGQTVTFNFYVGVSLWFFLKKYTKLKAAQILVCLLKIKTTLAFIFILQT